MINDPLRVLAVIDSLGEGGTERSLAELIGPLAERDVEVTIAMLRSRGDEGVESWLRADGRSIRYLRPGRRHIPGFRELVRELDPHVVHSMLYDANLTARLGLLGRRVPLLTSLVNTGYSPAWMDASNVPRLKLRAVQTIDVVTGRLLVDQFHAVSESVKTAAITHRHLPPSRITVIPRGRIDPRSSIARDARVAVRAELGIPTDARVVVNVGRHEAAKDQRTLMGAMRLVFETDSDSWLVIAGRDGSETQALTDELKAMGPQARRVRLLGHRRDVPSVLAASDLFVLSSVYEGMPGAVIEAMGVGLPVVATDIGPVHEVVECDRSALVVPPADPSALGQAIATLLHDQSKRLEFGTRGRAIFESSFRIDRSADEMASLYRRLARRRGPRVATSPTSTASATAPVRVLNLLNSDHRRGAEATGIAIGAALAAGGLDLRTVALRPSADDRRFDVASLTRSHRWPLALPELCRMARHADVVVGHGGSTLMAGVLMSGVTGTPFVYRVIGDPVYWTSTRLRRSRVAVAMRRASAVVTYFQRAADVIGERYGLPSDRLHVISKGIDADPFTAPTEAERSSARRALGLDDPMTKVIAYVGALSPEKNVSQILAAAARIEHAAVVLAGDGPERVALERQAHELGLSARFLGAISDPRLLYRAADVVALTSRTEGIPTVALEAGLMGLPVVASDVGGTRQVITDAETGFLVGVDDVSGTARALERAVADRVRLGAAARDRCLREFALDVVAARWAHLLAEVASRSA